MNGPINSPDSESPQTWIHHWSFFLLSLCLKPLSWPLSYHHRSSKCSLYSSLDFYHFLWYQMSQKFSFFLTDSEKLRQTVMYLSLIQKTNFKMQWNLALHPEMAWVHCAFIAPHVIVCFAYYCYVGNCTTILPAHSLFIIYYAWFCRSEILMTARIFFSWFTLSGDLAGI